VEEDESAEDVLAVPTDKVFGDDDSSDDFENNPAINMRLRMFHIV
jgi:hypothetical protein